MRRYAIRRNPGTGRWVMYYLARPVHKGRERPIYRIMGDAISQPVAIEGLFE